MDKKIKFAHLADLHLGGWRDRRLTELNFTTFRRAIDKVIEYKVDFCLFAGDIFNNALPPIDLVNRVVKEFIRLKEVDIPLYVIGGSHDYSNSGKSFIHLLESAGVFVDVCKFKTLDKNKVELEVTLDKKTGSRICGILGRKNGLDKNYYEKLQSETLSKDNLNIFMFHCTLDDLKPEFMKAVKSESNSSFLPKGFNYYAGGHVHAFGKWDYDCGTISYPGPLFPNNFTELIRESSTFNLCEFDGTKTHIERIEINTYGREYILVELKGEDPNKSRDLILNKIKDADVKGKIVLIEVVGVVEGKISDVGMNSIVDEIYEREAFHVLKNTYKLSNSKVEKKEINLDLAYDDVEEKVLGEYIEDNTSDEYKIGKELFSLDLSKKEDEKVSQYQDRIITAIEKSISKIRD